MTEFSDEEEPVYVRIEGYKYVLQNLEAVRQILENMGETVNVLKKLEDMKERSIETFLDNVQRLDERLDVINDEFPNVQMDNGKEIETDEELYDDENSEVFSKEEKELHENQFKDEKEETETVEEKKDPREEVVEESISELHTELKGLKKELENL